MHPRSVALGSAAAWAARIDALPFVACDAATATDAWVRALGLRRTGVRYYAAIALADPRLEAMRRHSETSVGSVGSIDALRLVLDDFAMSRLGAQARALPAAHEIAALQEIVRMSDGVVVRSWAEHARLRALLDSLERPAHVVCLADPRVPPPVGSGARTDVVVWAPDESIGALSGVFGALQDLGLPVTLVAAGTSPAFDCFRFAAAEEHAAALGRARVIVDATRNDPGTSLALAAHGRPLVVSTDAGAAEILDGVALYDPWSRRSLLAACADALALGAPQIRQRPALPPAPKPPAFAPTAPLVSVVVATHNRPELLDETLESIDRQTYPNVELIVVNDCGSDVTAVVTRHRNARLLTTPRNLGPAGARNVGLRDARGAYVIFFDDDDEMFPDHLAELAAALERSGADVAYGQMVNGLFARDADGSYRLDGFQAFDAILDHAEMQWNCSLAVTAVMFRRAIVEQVGLVDETLVGASDYDFYLRLTRGRVCARVPAVTSLYRWRTDDSNMSARARGRLLQAHRRIYEQHPSNRALVAAGRRETLSTLTQGADADAPWPAWALAAAEGSA